MQQTEEKAKRRALDVSGAQEIALSVSLVFLNMLPEDHFPPMALLYFMKEVSPYVIVMSNKPRLRGVFYMGCKFPDASAHVTEQSHVSGTWRNEDPGFEDAVLSWCLLMDS